MTPRRFPPPWRADKISGGYVVRDANGQALAYIYSRDSEAEAMQAKVLTKDEARRVVRALLESGHKSVDQVNGAGLRPLRRFWRGRQVSNGERSSAIVGSRRGIRRLARRPARLWPPTGAAQPNPAAMKPRGGFGTRGRNARFLR
jgi:hypothetical protein